MTLDTLSIEGKVALVTGGARGIGAMIARGLVEAGARVYIVSRDAERCARTADELGVLPIPADLADPAGREHVAEELARRESGLHVLVNNAAMHWRAPLEEQIGSRWDDIFALNVRAPFELTVGLLPLLEAAAQERDPARVINIGSADGLRIPALETYAYGASKAALHHLTRHMARRLARRHITVNAVAPGAFDTDMLAPVIEEYGDGVAKSSPLKRIAGGDDIAGVAVFLASRASAYITGAVLPVDGGMAI